MITTIIADDEPMIVRGLSKLIDWEHLGVEIVGTAYSGTEALRLVREKRPNLLISDINMPDLSGIELLKTLNEENASTQIIFISGFHDFEYAHAAIKYGAVDYLLKPVNENELLSAISKSLKEGQTRDYPVPQDPFLLTIPEFPDDSSGYFSVLNCTMKDQMMSGSSRSEFDIFRFSALNAIRDEFSKVENLWVVEKDSHILVIIRQETKDEAFRKTHDLAEKMVYFLNSKFAGAAIIATGKIVSESRKINEAYFTSLEAISNGFYSPDARVLYYRESAPIRHSIDTLYSSQSKVIDSLLKFDNKALKESLSSYADVLNDVTFGNREATVSHVLGLIVMVKKSLQSLDIQLTVLERNTQIILGELHDLQNFQLITNWLETCIKSVSEELKEFQGTKIHPEIQKIKAYIHENFHENITLQDLSDLVFLHPNYLSSHFKKFTGKNFKDYLTEVRMKEAEKLLNISDLKVYEIAEQVGFTDYRYFSELFKRTFGVGPRDYRSIR